MGSPVEGSAEGSKITRVCDGGRGVCVPSFPSPRPAGGAAQKRPSTHTHTRLPSPLGPIVKCLRGIAAVAKMFLECLLPVPLGLDTRRVVLLWLSQIHPLWHWSPAEAKPGPGRAGKQAAGRASA